jgi:5-methylcytosine-specific restriction endonuclease McrA
MDAATKRHVRRRARNRCEYCGLHQKYSPLVPLQIEHIIPKKHGGGDDPQNLALACIDCNLSKGSNLSGIDPRTSRISELYHPRRDRWDDHFERRGPFIVGKTPIGRATVRVLNMNSEDQIELRSFIRQQ